MTGQTSRNIRAIGLAIAGVGATLALGAVSTLRPTPSRAQEVSTACPGDNGGLVLSPGFCATVFADNLGHLRQMAVSPDGVLYVNSWSGIYYPGSPPPAGGFLIALKDKDGDGRADTITRFGPAAADGAAGGTGLYLYRNSVYAEVNDRVVRYMLGPGEMVPTGKAQTILSGMPLTGDHPMHPFIIDPKGQLFVDMGTATNACQAKNRAPEVPGAEPCTESLTRGGIWRYDARILGQVFSAKARYATGLRNGEGLSFDSAGRLFATQHGRDQLLQNWPKLYTDAAATTELPAEELVQVTEGGDYGWPRCYFDRVQNKLVLAPEYGGDGGKAVGVCAKKQAPIAAFPAHWGPNDMKIYGAKAFPAPYQGGAFIAFHGSWNRAPAPQAGYNVVFQPMKDGQAAGPWIVFADGFAGGQRDPAKARFRPTGLVVGPDGALYISDDVKGRIWRVTYHGPANIAAVAAAPALPDSALPPVSASTAGLPPPPGHTADELAQGEAVYRRVGCAGCHGADGKGTPLGPDLTSGHPLWGDGSFAAILDNITHGVPQPKQYRSPMPAMGGAQLSPADLQAVTAYVWAIGQAGK